MPRDSCDIHATTKLWPPFVSKWCQEGDEKSIEQVEDRKKGSFQKEIKGSRHSVVWLQPLVHPFGLG